MMEVKVTKTTNPKVKPDPATVPFGVAFYRPHVYDGV